MLMITALDDPPSVIRCIGLGAEDYLAKPFDPLLLRARVSSCLSKKRARDFERPTFVMSQRYLGRDGGRGGHFDPTSLDEVGRATTRWAIWHGCSGAWASRWPRASDACASRCSS